MATSRKPGWLTGKFRRRQKTTRRKTPYGCQLGFEPLEDRQMLSGISWSNRGGPGNDSDGFASVFGANAEAARNTAQGAIDLWRRVVTNLNQSGGSNQLDVSINMQSTGVGFGGSGAVTSLIGNKPRTGAILLNRGNDSNNDGVGDGVNWFLDSTPLDNSEYNNGAIINPFAALPNPGSGIVADFMTLITVEMAHVLGVSNNVGLAWRNNPFVTNTHQPDVRDAPGTLWTFDGPTVSALLTSNNGGGGGTDTGLPVHVAYSPNQYFGPTKSYNGVADVGTAGGDASIRYLPSKLMVHMLRDVYGYTIIEPENYGTFHAMLQSNGQLRIRGGLPAGLNFPSNDSIRVFASGANINVVLDLGNEVAGTGISGNEFSGFLTSQVSSILIDAGDGNDSILVDTLQSNVPVTVIGGTGTDTLEIGGSPGNDTLTATAFSVSSTFVNVTSYGTIESLLWTPGLGTADVFVPSGVLFPFSINMAAGAGALNIQTLAQLSNLTINGSSGNDIINIAPNGGANTIQSNITVNGGAGDDTLNLGGGNLNAITGTITFDGTSGLNDRVILNDQVPNNPYGYNVSTTSVQRDGLFGGLAYANLDRIILNCGPGDNTISVFVGIIEPVEVHGNAGFDTIVFNDSVASTGKIWNINPDQVIINGALTSTDGFEGVGILAGNGADQITFSGGLGQSFNVDAGGGADAITIGYLSQVVFASVGPTIINGGEGNDSFIWQRGSNNWGELIYGPFTSPVTLEGGGGYNTLSVDDTTRGNTSYQFYADRFYSFEPNVFPEGADFHYSGMKAIGLGASNGTNAISIFGTSSDIDVGNQVSISLAGGNDSVTLFPRDAQGNLTINGNVGIGGGSGSDTLLVNDSTSTLPIAYTFINPFGAGTQNIAGLGSAGFGVGSDFEGITINAGTGDDTFVVEKYLGVIPLTINAGPGNDTFDVTPTSKNLAANMATFNPLLAFYGGEGYDTIGIHNDNNNNSYFYTVDGTRISVANTFATPTPLFNVNIQHSLVEYTAITGGPKSDYFVVDNSAPGTVYDFDGGPGPADDQFYTGETLIASLLSGIHGGVYVNGTGGGNDTVTISNISDPTGRTVHIGNQFVGATPGDDLFGAGGYLHYTGITGAMTINLGPGADTVYAAPDPLTPLIIKGNGPAGAGSGSLSGGSSGGVTDFLGLAFANAANPVLVPGGAGAGSYTFDDAAPVTFSGMESTEVDNVAPYIVAQSYDGLAQNIDGIVVPTIFVEFSEDVSNALSVGDLELINTTTSEPVPLGSLNLAYDAGTNIASFTFPGYPDGVLPAGDYTATISGALPDLFGNQIGVETPLLFTIAPTPPALPGDYNLNGIVDAADYTVWRDALGSSVSPYVGADGDGSGTVDTADYDVWTANFGAALGAAATAQTAASATTMPDKTVARIAEAVSVETPTINELHQATALLSNDELRPFEARHSLDRAFAAFLGPFDAASAPSRPWTTSRAASLQSTPRSVTVNSRAVELLFTNPLSDNPNLSSTVLPVRRSNAHMTDASGPTVDEFFRELSRVEDVSPLHQAGRMTARTSSSETVAKELA